MGIDYFGQTFLLLLSLWLLLQVLCPLSLIHEVSWCTGASPPSQWPSQESLLAASAVAEHPAPQKNKNQPRILWFPAGNRNSRFFPNLFNGFDFLHFHRRQHKFLKENTGGASYIWISNIKNRRSRVFGPSLQPISEQAGRKHVASFWALNPGGPDHNTNAPFHGWGT